MQYSSLDITALLNAQLLNNKAIENSIEFVVYDSRKTDFPDRSIFFAFESTHNDGHNFIPELYQKGLRNFVVSKPVLLSAYPGANFFHVDDCLVALQKLAIFHRSKFNLPVIGITGSNGKTIIKEWLYQLLHDDFSIVRSPRSFNSQIGVPLSVLQLKSHHNLGIFEAGISQTAEMQKLQPIIQCSIGLFTNIGQAHDEGFDHINQKISEKAKLFSNSELVVCCKDHEKIFDQLSQLPGRKIISWSISQDADLTIRKMDKLSNHQTFIEAEYQKRTVQIQLPFNDTASIENAIHCWLILLILGIPDEIIRGRMMYLKSVPMRLELKSAVNASTLINDSYNSDLTSLASALNFLEQQSGQLSRTVILSDILQSGKSPDVLYREVASLLQDKGVHKVIGIGPEVVLLNTYLTSDQFLHYSSTAAFLKQYDPEHFQKEIILLKGARKFEFEKIARHLARKNHNTRLEIDLNALTHNLKVFRNVLDDRTKLMVMVKAAAYGSGSAEIARLLQYQNVDYLAVAYTDEGVELRKAGIKTPIMVLNPEKATFDAALRFGLEPEIYSLSLLSDFAKSVADDQTVSIHLKLDTGMHRLGFEAQDIPALTDFLARHSNLKVASIFSHLVGSDEEEHDAFTIHQTTTFNNLYEKICHELKYRPIRHILNSSGIIRFPQYQLDMVRLGIGLYGIDPNDLLKNQLQTVLSLKASISQIKTVQANETIGYSRKGIARKESRIATISIGYADGLLRKAGNGHFQVRIHGKHAPTIGNVCMDMTMVDVSDIPEANEGDEVIIFGKEHPVQKLAQCYDSLVYEVFTGISERVKRVYFQD